MQFENTDCILNLPKCMETYKKGYKESTHDVICEQAKTHSKVLLPMSSCLHQQHEL